MAVRRWSIGLRRAAWRLAVWRRRFAALVEAFGAGVGVLVVAVVAPAVPLGALVVGRAAVADVLGEGALAEGAHHGLSALLAAVDQEEGDEQQDHGDGDKEEVQVEHAVAVEAAAVVVVVVIVAALLSAAECLWKGGGGGEQPEVEERAAGWGQLVVSYAAEAAVLRWGTRAHGGIADVALPRLQLGRELGRVGGRGEFVAETWAV